ncbi:CHASE2 domain-containing protein [Phormidesmis priestleyi]
MTSFRLKIWRIEQTCLFELSWGKNQQLTAQLIYPETLTTLYHEWRQIYLSFYHSALLARIEMSGSLAPPAVDWRAKLVQAEAKLLSEFYYWLNSAELLEIRKAIAEQASSKIGSSSSQAADLVDIFLTCEPLELARFPWETWEIGTATVNQIIRIARTPANMRDETVQRPRRGRMRILAIMGDDTGVDLQASQAAVQSLKNIAEVKFVGWRQKQTISDLKAEICHTIADPQGWDILFFTGHSNETMLTGGELAIAPGESMMIREIAPQLTQAKEHGLQFAIFNSCNGLSIANSLIDLGISQVAVMREPIHNHVAQEFLISFLQHLTADKDVHESLFLACQYLKLERNLTYPSAYLIPSLFRHPDAAPFKSLSWRRSLAQWLPTRREAIGLSALILLSGFAPVQSWLLNNRVAAQSVYRQVTGQTGSSATPPVLLVQIDNDTIQKQKIWKIDPMDRTLLANVVDRLSALDAKVIGIDYLLDRTQPDDRKLGQSVRAAVQKNAWFVFAAKENDEGSWSSVLPEIATPKWSLQGDIWIPSWYVRPLPWSNSPRQQPFAYQLTIAHQNQSFIRPNLQSQVSLQEQVKVRTHQTKDQTRMQLHPITALSYFFQQRWLQPILDFSIPPNQVYDTVSAAQLLENPQVVLESRGLSSLQKQIVVIAPGGYDGVGTMKGGDNFSLPAAIAYWRSQQTSSNNNRGFTGGEAHAYMIHHFLTNHLIVPIPDMWMILIAALLVKGATLKWTKRPRFLLLGLTMGYGLVCLQLYLTAMLLLPWLLPSIVLLTYTLPTSFRGKNA